MPIPDYHSYRNLPPVAGIASFAEAMQPGLSIDECVARLKRHHWAFRRLHGIFIQRLAAEPVYELKMGFSLHAHYCAEHAAAWRQRVGEMREPPLGLDGVPHPALDAFFDEVLAAPDTGALLLGIYEQALPVLRCALQRHMAETNRLVDHPSYRLCRFALIEVDEMIAYGAQAVPAMLDPAGRAARQPWVTLLAELLAQAGGMDGSNPVTPGEVRRQFSALPRTPDFVPQRDERFPDPYNMGVHAEVFLYDPAMPVAAKPLMMYYKRLREIDVPEMMASIIGETTGKPWEYTVDMTRQLWDEARHAMMGEIGFLRAGLDWRKLVRVNFTWSLALNTQLQPLERHAVLYFIEQGLMPKTGKRFEWEVGQASGDAFSALIQDYDWADEVLHARIGRDWYVKAIGDAKKAVEYGDACWSRVLIDWRSYRERGLTTHENWWPALYAEWCRLQGRDPDPAALAYQTSYEAARADLKGISASA
ncbi:MAG: hypothetical protein PSV13_09995 [Lacunisphaera sp.]|nr:hypothetical protein [Lacunisphaera sp.]